MPYGARYSGTPNGVSTALLNRIATLETALPSSGGGIVLPPPLEVFAKLGTALDEGAVYTARDVSAFVPVGAVGVILRLCVYVGAALDATTVLRVRAIGETSGGLEGDGSIGVRPYMVASYNTAYAFVLLTPDRKFESNCLNTALAVQRSYRIDRMGWWL